MDSRTPTTHTTPVEIIGEEDVVFECSKCGKSLVIDARGAGMIITCPDCGTEVQVPPPPNVLASGSILESQTLAEDNDDKDAGMPEISDVLSDAREQIKDLQVELEELRFRRRHLEKQHTQTMQAVQLLKHQVVIVRAAMDQIEEVLKALTALTSGDTQPLR
jgi:predicted RNA-binding Zn-ribbon protein involved in translation (DUF1610 family)